MNKSLKVAVIGKECVACGCCLITCPKDAIYINSGITACVRGDMCVGCGKCAGICPAGVIDIAEKKVN